MSRLMEDMSSIPSTASTSQEGHESNSGSTSSRKLRVTFLSSEWRSTKGGLSTINRELAIQLAKHPSVEVSVYLPECSEDDKRVATSHNVHLIEAEKMQGLGPDLWLSCLPEDHAVDCVIGHGAVLGRQVQIIKRHHHCKWIQVVHTSPEELGMYKEFEEHISRGEEKHQVEVELCKLADQVVAVGPKLADAFSGYLRPCGKDQDVLNLTPGIFSEFADVSQATEERNSFNVLVFGRGDIEDFQLKGYDIAGQAIAELKDTTYKLVFVGATPGEEEKVARKLVEQGIDPSQLKERRFNESGKKLADLFCEVDLAVMPSRTEGFGLAALEALSAGLPVLVSGKSGLAEALKKVPHGSSCVVESEDPKDWASTIRAVRHKDREMRLGEFDFVRGAYAKKYSWKEQCDKLVERMKVISSEDSSKRLQSLDKGKRPLSPSDTSASKQSRLLRYEESASETSATDPPQVIARQIRNKDLPVKSKPFDDCQIPVDILLLTVMKEDTFEDCEFLSCLAYLNPDFCKVFHSDLGYVYFGDMGEDDLKLKVAVVKLYEGSPIVVINAVRVLKPKAVFSVGSCSGLNVTEVSLGDVVVLKRLVTYAFSKVTENGIEERGVKVPYEAHISKLILNASHGWMPPLKDPGTFEVKIHRGTFLSGPEVINNQKRCNALIERFPEAVAIERESEGVYAAAYDLDIDLVVIKGVSGYADGRKVKDSWRTFASFMAASLTAHILSDTIAFQALPHLGSARRKRKASQELDGMIEDKKARNIFSHLQDLQSDTVLVSNKTNPLSDLRKIALDKGFVISDNPASGNCLFYALSEQLKSVKAIHTSHKEVREVLVQFLTANAYLRDGTPLFNFVSGYPSWPEYLQSMAEDGTWGDHMVLLAAANYFQSPIRIISSRDHEIVVQPDHAVADINPLVLGHVHEFHYVSLHPSQESIPSYVLARGQTAIAAFIKAKADGWTLDKRVKVLLIGQDRVGKTSVGRSLKGEKFRANEISTEGVQMYEPLKNPGDQPWKNYVLQHETTAFHHKSAEIISREVQLKSTGGQTPKKGLGTESQKSSNLDATADNSQKDSPSEFSNLSRPHPFEEEGTASLHSTPDNEKKMENTSSNEPVPMDNKIADLTAEKLHRKGTDIPDGIWPVIWDFAGQALFRAIHPIFMSSEAVYVLVWDLTRDLFAKAQCKVNEDGREEVDVLTADSNDTNLDHILRWLDMVHSLRPEGNSEFPPVILVGTHADEVNFPDKKKEELEEFLRVNFEDYYNHVVESVTMDNTLAGRPIQEEDKQICQLRQITLKEAENLSHTQKKIPLKWLEVENKVCDHIKKSEDKYMTKQSFKEKIVDQICQPDRDQNLAEHILNFMHDRGSIVYLDHPETPNGLVVLDPQWLVHDVLCKIVTIKNQKGDKPEIKRYRRNLKEKGILNVALLNYACENLNLHGIKKHLILIMRKFNLLCENTKDINGETEYLVPCMLTRKPEKDLTCDDRKVVCEPVFITFDTEYVPFGLFSRILVLFGQWAASRTSCERPQLFANAARFFIAKTTSLSLRFDCFKRVIKIFILKGTEPNPMHNNQQVLIQASRFLKQILERLKQECHWLRRVSLRLCAQCKLCLKAKSCLWHKEQKCSHEDCTHYVDINDKPFVCVNDLSSNSAIPQTWIQVLASGKEDVKQCVKVKMGIPSNEVLEELSLRITETWRQLGRRLRIDESQLDAFDRENHQCREKGYKMLLSWKQRDGGSDASYQVLYDALCHNLVGLGKLAKEICCD